MTAGRTLRDVVAIKQDLEDLLGRRVDVMTEAALSPYLRDAVLREAVQLGKATASISNNAHVVFGGRTPKALA